MDDSIKPWWKKLIDVFFVKVTNDRDLASECKPPEIDPQKRKQEPSGGTVIEVGGKIRF